MMKKNNHYQSFFALLLVVVCGVPAATYAEDVTIDASTLVPEVEVSITPRTGSFIEGSTFEVPILIDTNGVSVNALEIKISFDASRLSIVLPSGGKSIIGVWAEPPSFNNIAGAASYVGIIPGGITTDAGLVGSITFRAIRAGSASVTVSATSNVLLNDGIGTPAEVGVGRATYTILPRPTEGVAVYSETHPSQSEWYNNNSPVFSWDELPGAVGYSVALDTYPSTIPENEISTKETSQSFTDVEDGLWYFHVKAVKDGAWGSTSHFLVRIDTAPPASFKPQVDFVVAAAVLVKRVLVSFFTTDNLSGVDRYEVGIIDKTQPTTISPIFIQTESPFQVPLAEQGNVRVVVRAIDRAGNIRDESIDVRSPLPFIPFGFQTGVIALMAVLLLMLGGVVAHRRFFKRRTKFDEEPQTYIEKNDPLKNNEGE